MKNIFIILIALLVFPVASIAQTASNKLDSTGRVGVGTLNPENLVHIKFDSAQANFNPVLTLEHTYNGGFTQMAFKGTGRTFHVGVGNSGCGFGLRDKFFIYDLNDDISRIVLDSFGNVGIGTTSPSSRLTISSGASGVSGLQFNQLTSSSTVSASNGKVLSLDAAGKVILVNDAGGVSGWSITGNNGTNPATNYIGTGDARDFVIRSHAVERMRFFANGNIGIGSSSNNGRMLQVTGTGYFSDTVLIGTSASITTDYKLLVNGGIKAHKVKVDMDSWPDYVFDPGYKRRGLNELASFISLHKHLPEVPAAKEVEKEGLDVGANQAILLKKIEELTLYLIEEHKQVETLTKLVRQQQEQIDQLKKQKD